MSTYLFSPSGQAPGDVWSISRKIAIRTDVTNAKHGLNTYFEAGPGETIWDKLRRAFPGWGSAPGGKGPFYRTALEPAQYYPRMARPLNQAPHAAHYSEWSPSVLGEEDFMAIARGQLTTLTRLLDRICETIHPTDRTVGSLPKTFNAYGHDIRNLLILACTEVETHWRGVLVANGKVKKKNKKGDDMDFKTSDYVALQRAMRLGEYAVSFHKYPWLEARKPFKAWRSSKATQSLKWYAAYNAVKHDREFEFAQATLHHVFDAISACVIMMVAQFGRLWGLGYGSEALSSFHFSSVPAWSLSETYIGNYGATNVLGAPPDPWSPVPFKF